MLLPTPLTGSDFAHVRAFLAVGRALSFSRAAAVLGISPSALSQLIRSFETRLGVRLLHRTTRSVALTEAGETLLARLGPAVSALGDAIGEARQNGSEPAGTVRIHASRLAAERYVQPILAGFCARHPRIVLDVTADDAVVDLVAGGFDAGIRIGEVIQRDMVAVRLGPDLRQIPVAAPAYLARHGTPAHPRELLEHSCILWRWAGTALAYRWEFFDPAAGGNGHWFEVAVTGPLVTDSKRMALEATLAGIGIGFVVEETARAAIAAGRLVPMLESWCAPFPGHHLCYPAQRQMAPALRAFIDALRAGATDGTASWT